jgi:hypothetical protein
MRENFEKQLGELRAEIEILRSVVKAGNVELIKKGRVRRSREAGR